jgi:hypothetical protein
MSGMWGSDVYWTMSFFNLSQYGQYSTDLTAVHDIWLFALQQQTLAIASDSRAILRT